MRLGKNKKKQWRHCVPEIEEDILKAKENNEIIGDISFDISNKSSTNIPKYSTAPQRIIKRPNIVVPGKRVIDIWSKDAVAPVISKRRQRHLDELRSNREVYESRSRTIHPGTSYRPLEHDHADLLQRLQVDYERKVKLRTKMEKKMDIIEDSQPVQDSAIETEEINDESDYIKDPLKIVKSTTKKHKNRRNHNVNQERLLNIKKKKLKADAHMLINIPKINKAILMTNKEQDERRQERVVRDENIKDMKQESKSLEKVDFLLPSEVPSCLRRLVPSEGILSDIVEKIGSHKFKVDKKKKQRKLTKTVKKNGLEK